MQEAKQAAKDLEMPGAAFDESSALLANQAKSAAALVSERFHELRRGISAGNVALRVMSLFAAGLMILDGFFAFFSLLSFSPLRALIEIYVFLAGLVALTVEATLDWERLAFFQEVLRHKANFLYLMTGRGSFYIFFGTLIFAQWPVPYDVLVGAYLVAVGITMIAAGRQAASKMEKFRRTIVNEEALREHFDSYDASADGKLQPVELAKLCEGLGSTMSRAQLEAAFFMLDRDQSGAIEFNEFLSWWRQEGEMAMLAKYFEVQEEEALAEEGDTNGFFSGKKLG